MHFQWDNNSLLLFARGQHWSWRMLSSYYYYYYLRRRLASGEGIVTLGVTLSRCVCVRRVSLGGEGNALYPVLPSYCHYCTWQ